MKEHLESTIILVHCTQFTRTEPWFTAVFPVIDLRHVLMLEDVDCSVDMKWSMDVVGGGGDEGRVGSLHVKESLFEMNVQTNVLQTPGWKKWQVFKGAEGFCSFLCTDSSDIQKWISAGLSTYGPRQSVAHLQHVTSLFVCRIPLVCIRVSPLTFRFYSSQAIGHS